MKPVGCRVVDVHRERHETSSSIALVLSPRYNGRKKFSVVEDVHVEAAAAQPRKARYVKEIRRPICGEASAVFVFFSVFQESRVKIKKVGGIFRDGFRAFFVVFVEFCI